MLDRFNVFDNTKVHDINKVEREKMDTFLKVEKKEKDASKEELKTNDSNWRAYDVTDLHGLLLLVNLALHCAVDHQTTLY